MNKSLFLLVFLQGFVVGSHCLPENLQVKWFQQDTNDMIARQNFDDSLVGKFCKSNIPPLATGALLGILFAGITKICEGLTYDAHGTFPVKTVGTLGFFAGYAPVAIIQFLVLKRFGMR